MTQPLTPADCDLRDFAFMPLDVVRLRQSELVATNPPAACFAALMLWGTAWHEVPAASISSDERVLAAAAGYRGDPKGWRKVRDGAMHGFVLCSDGRLYHPVVAVKALEAWLEKLAQRVSGGEGNAKRWGTEFDRGATIDAAVEAVALLRALEPKSKALAKKFTASLPKQSRRDAKPIPPGIPSGSRPDIPVGSQGTGTGTGTTPIAPAAAERDAADARLRSVCAALGLPLEPRDWPTHWSGLLNKLETWQSAGADYRLHILPACADFRAKNSIDDKGASYLGAIVMRLAGEAKARPAAYAVPSNGIDPRAPDSDFKAIARLEAHGRGEWIADAWGPPPGEPGCLIPAHVLEQFRAKRRAA